MIQYFDSGKTPGVMAYIKRRQVSNTSIYAEKVWQSLNFTRKKNIPKMESAIYGDYALK